MELIVGTAGHIDHGKTSLIKALTGVDTDRLPEEKRRGITVDLGFAEMTEREVHIGFVDVPGHEKSVKNMLAGASGIGAVLLVVAATEGVMPQTREHFDICRLLGIKAGVIAITKCDAADRSMIEAAKDSVRELVSGSFLENSQMIESSTATGVGIEDIRSALANCKGGTTPTDSKQIARLPIDRSFSIKGFGAVVTGTLAAGEIREGDEMELMPPGLKVRVRGLQSHERSVSSVTAPQRVAANLGGIDHKKAERGMTLAPVGSLRATQILDTMVEVLDTSARPLRSGQRVRLHLGAAEFLCRVEVLGDAPELAPGGSGFVQLRLERNCVAVPDERFILRFYSPAVTIAGGVVIDNQAVRHRRDEMVTVRERLSRLVSAADDVSRARAFLEMAGAGGMTTSGLSTRMATPPEQLSNIASGSEVVRAGGIYIHAAAFESLCSRALAAVRAFHLRERLKAGMPREELREEVFNGIPKDVFQRSLEHLVSDGKLEVVNDVVAAADREAVDTPSEARLKSSIMSAYTQAALEPPPLSAVLDAASAGSEFSPADARKYFQVLLDAGKIVKVTDDLYFDASAVLSLTEKLNEAAAKLPERSIDVPAFKTIAGVSRKYAIPLLEYFDRNRVTVRVGDKRRVL